MRHYKENNHLVLKLLVGIVALFLVVVAVKDWTPTQIPVEKTVVYNDQ